MKPLYTLFLVLLGSNGISQTADYLIDNQEWLVKEDCSFSYPCIEKATKRYYLGGDSTVNNVVFKKLYERKRIVQWWASATPPAPGACSSVINSDDLIGLIRQDNKKLFFNDDLLYDFDLNVGDFLPITYNQVATDLEVTSIGTLMINGQSRNQFFINNDPDFFLIEGIGFNGGLLEFIGQSLECAGFLDCFQIASQTEYSSPNGTCEFNLDLNENDVFSFEIFPNPSIDQLTLTFRNIVKSGFVTIYQLDGKKVIEERITGTNKLNLNHSLNPGTYLIEVEINDSKSSQTLIVN